MKRRGNKAMDEHKIDWIPTVWKISPALRTMWVCVCALDRMKRRLTECESHFYRVGEKYKGNKWERAERKTKTKCKKCIREQELRHCMWLQYEIYICVMVALCGTGRSHRNSIEKKNKNRMVAGEFLYTSDTAQTPHHGEMTYDCVDVHPAKWILRNDNISR